MGTHCRLHRRPAPWCAGWPSTSAHTVVLGVLTEAGHARLVLTEADAVFVSRAREAVPRLVAEVERLQALLDKRGDDDVVGDSA